MLYNDMSWYYRITVNFATHFHGCVAVRTMLYVIIFYGLMSISLVCKRGAKRLVLSIFLHDLFTLQVLESDEFSEASDVWSFAYVVTEVFTFGKQPYQDWKNGKVIMISYHFGRADCHGVRCSSLLTPPLSCSMEKIMYPPVSYF